MDRVRIKETARQPSAAQLKCSACGATAKAACNCGAPYVPAGVLAAKAVAASPEKSNRAIADEIGVGFETVRRARQSGDPNGSPAKRTGKDGKSYPAKKAVADEGPPVSAEVIRLNGHDRAAALDGSQEITEQRQRLRENLDAAVAALVACRDNTQADALVAAMRALPPLMTVHFLADEIERWKRGHLPQEKQP
jgi:hypothetical protein